MSLRSKMLAIMALPVMVLVVATFALLKSRQQTTEALKEERDAVVLRDTLNHILLDLTNAETGTRGYLLTGETSFLEPYTRGASALIRDMRELNDLIGGGSVSAEEMTTLRELTNHNLSTIQTIQLLAPVTDRTNHSQLIQELNSAKAIMDQIRAVVDREKGQAADLLAQRQRSLDASRHIAFFVGVIGMPLGVLAALLVVMLFVQRLTRRIGSMEEIARMIEGGTPLREPSPSDDEIGRLERVLVQTGTRVGELQGELRRMGATDQLTRLMNRRGFLPTAQHRLKEAERTKQPMALMFLDLDGLKRVNDALGHTAGDGMLTEGAFVLRETFRASDLIARLGGDEFCVLFGAQSYHTAKIALTRLKNAVDIANQEEGRPYTLSFSAGVAMFDPTRPVTLDQLMALADEKMYERKRAKISGPSSPVSPPAGPVPAAH